MAVIKKLHKWLSLLVGLQLLIWLGSGLFFNLMDHDKASGNKYYQKQTLVEIDNAHLIEPKAILSQFPATVTLKQISLLAQPYYLLNHAESLYRHFKNNYTLVNATTGDQLKIDKHIAVELAQSSYHGPGVIGSALKLSPPYTDIPKEKNEVWQVNYTDDVNTSVYIDAGSGRIIKHSNDDKRFVDFFFMLHFMDYGTEGSFNNIQIIVFAIFTLFFCLTGIIWTIELAFNGQYKISFGSKTRNISLVDSESKPMGEFLISSKYNLLEGLAKHDIYLPSICGGGGTCGRCVVKMDKSVKVTSADYEKCSQDELDQGYRLACQHSCKEIKQLNIINATLARKRR